MLEFRRSSNESSKYIGPTRTGVPDGVFTLTMHPQTIGRGHRLLMLESLIDEWRARLGVTFARALDVAEAFRARSTS